MATQQRLPSSQVKLAIGSNRCKQNWIWKKTLKYGFNFWQGIDWSNDALHPLKIISVILRCWWRALQYWRYFDKVVTHFKLHDVLHSLIDKICSSLILRCHHMLMYSFLFRPIKQQWSFNVMSRLYFSRSWQKGSEYPLICFCMPENSVRVGRTLS